MCRLLIYIYINISYILKINNQVNKMIYKKRSDPCKQKILTKKLKLWSIKILDRKKRNDVWFSSCGP